MSQKNWFILNRVSQLHKLQKLLKEIPFIEMSGESIYLRLGYKILSPAEKETYYFMRDLTLFSRYKFEEKFSSEEISPSLDYLATCLGTNTKTQSERIAKLEKYGLITKTRRKFRPNIYLVNTQPLPDSTFVTTLILLIRRKRVLDLLTKHKFITDSFEKNVILDKLHSLTKNPSYKQILKKIPKVADLLKEQHT